MINPVQFPAWLMLLLFQAVAGTPAYQRDNPVDVPDPIAFYPLNGEYKTKEMNNRQPEGRAFNVHLAAGPDGAPYGSYQFMGMNNSYIEFPNNGSLDTRASITILLWLNPENKDGPLFDYYNASIHPFTVHFWLRYGYLSARFASLGPDSHSEPVTSSKPVKPDQWQLVGVTYNQMTGIVQFWMDGEPDEWYFIGKIDRLASVGNARVGVRPGDFKLYFKGRIAQIRVYDIPLTPDQVKSIADIMQVDVPGSLQTASFLSVSTSIPSKSAPNSVFPSVYASVPTKAPEPVSASVPASASPSAFASAPKPVSVLVSTSIPGSEPAPVSPSVSKPVSTSVPAPMSPSVSPSVPGSVLAPVSPSVSKSVSVSASAAPTSTSPIKPTVDICAKAQCFNGGSCEARGSEYTCNCANGFIGTHCEWAAKGCFKESKKASKMAMKKVFKTLQRKYSNIADIVQECIRQAEEDGLKIFGIRDRIHCVTSVGSRHYSKYGGSKNCEVKGSYGIGEKKANFVYVLSKEE